MRLALLLFASIAALPLLGANSDDFPAPVVVVYPLTQTSGSSPDTGSNIAILIATKLGQLGGIVVKPYTPGTQRPQYLENALKQNADYYITGFLTPLGAELSMISQVVSTHSGSVVYSTTIAAKTYADAAGQADLLHDAILRHAGRGLAALDAPPPAPSSSPAPDVGSKGVNITQALRHRGRSTPAPSPAASGSPLPAGAAVAVAPAKASAAAVHGRTLVIEVGGDSDQTTRRTLGTALTKTLSAQGFASGFLPVTESDIHAHAKDLCAANPGTRTMFASTLVVGHATATTAVTLDVTAYDCAGTALGKQHVAATGSGRDALTAALQRAATAAAAAFSKSGIPAKPGA